MHVSDLPELNAALNATSAVLLWVGRGHIRRGNVRAHRACMVSAFCVSSAFLVSYLIYHWYSGHHAFAGPAIVRPIYLAILISHILLAFVVLCLSIPTLYLAARARFDRHRRLARWTYPIWMYVSVTGVIVYLMLYRIFPGPSRL